MNSFPEALKCWSVFMSPNRSIVEDGRRKADKRETLFQQEFQPVSITKYAK